MSSPRSEVDPPISKSAFRWWLTTPLVVYAFFRAFTALIVLVASPHTVAGGLAGWDGKWFIDGAVHGWPRHLPMIDGHVAANPIAFFPLLPLVMRAGAWLRLGAQAVGLVISLVAGGVAVVGVGTLAREMTDEARGRRAALLFALFPGSFVFSFIYAEGILISAVAFGLIALLRRRWLAAGVLGIVASASSPVGFAFVLSCALASLVAIRRDRALASLLAPVLAPLGGLGWLVFLWVHTGRLNAWRSTERGGWQSYPSLRYPFHIIARFVFDPTRPTLTGQILFFGTVAGVIGIVLAIKERQPGVVLIYAITALAMALISAPVGLRPRFLLVAFPIIIAVGTRYTGRTFQVIAVLFGIGLCAMTLMTVFSNAVFP